MNIDDLNFNLNTKQEQNNTHPTNQPQFAQPTESQFLLSEQMQNQPNQTVQNRKVVLSVENLTKAYNQRYAVDNISFAICEGQIFGFLGANGAGKSTTIKMLTGLTSITSGNAFINGHSVKTNFQKAIENVGAIIEIPQFYPYLSSETLFALSFAKNLRFLYPERYG